MKWQKERYIDMKKLRMILSLALVISMISQFTAQAFALSSVDPLAAAGISVTEDENFRIATGGDDIYQYTFILDKQNNTGELIQTELSTGVEVSTNPFALSTPEMVAEYENGQSDKWLRAELFFKILLATTNTLLPLEAQTIGNFAALKKAAVDSIISKHMKFPKTQ